MVLMSVISSASKITKPSLALKKQRRKGFLRHVPIVLLFQMVAIHIAWAVSQQSVCGGGSRGKADGERPPLSLWPVIMAPDHPAEMHRLLLEYFV